MMSAESLGKKPIQNTSQAALALERRYLAANDSFAEKHYRVSDLAELWGLGRETVRKLVKDDPGVIKIRMGRKRAHTVYSVPESAVRRIHTRLLMGA
ncbi:MAG: hypothetical protein WBE55_11885 [Candidatus Sulfotelmatobacter sp.]|jgi:hypothetical protein